MKRFLSFLFPCSSMHDDQRGSAAVEFAIVAPILLTIIYGIIEVGVYLFAQESLQRSVEVAARCAAIQRNDCLDDEAIKLLASESAFGLSIDKSAYSVTSESCGVRVSASYDFDIAAVLAESMETKITASSCFEN